MSKIGIIAGGGKLPILIGEQLIQSGNKVVFFCIESYAKKSDYKNFVKTFIKLELISEIIKILKIHKIEKIIMAGYVKRPSLKDIKFDLKGLKLIKEYALQPLPDLEPFFWMEGGNENIQAFLLVPPSHVLETYSIEVSKEDVDFLSLQSTEDALILNIVTYGPNQTMTVNLKGPILVNRHTMVAKQVVPTNAAVLPTTFPLNN